MTIPWKQVTSRQTEHLGIMSQSENIAFVLCAIRIVKDDTASSHSAFHLSYWLSAHHVVSCHLKSKVMIWVTIHRRRWSEGYAAPDSYSWILAEL